MHSYDASYFEGILLYLIPGALLAFFTFLWFIGFTCARAPCCRDKCCYCCQGRQINKDKPFGLFHIIFGLLFWIVVLTGMGIGFSGNRMVDDTVSDFTNTLNAGFEEVTISASNAVVNLTSINASSDVVSSFTDVRDQLDNSTSDVDSFEKDVHDGNYDRMIVIYISFALPGIAFILALLGFVIRSNPCNILMMYAGIFAAFVIWLSFGVHLPASMLVMDACDDSYTILNGNGTAPPSAVIKSQIISSCLQNYTYGPPFDTLYNDLTNQTKTLIQNAQEAGVTGLSTNIPPEQGTDAVSINILVMFIDQQIGIMQPQVDKMEEPEKDRFQTEIYQVSNYSAIALNMADTMSCVVVREFFRQVVDIACGNGKEHLYFILVADAVIGVFIYFALMTCFVTYVHDGPPRGERQRTDDHPLSPVYFQNRPPQQLEHEGVRYHT